MNKLRSDQVKTKAHNFPFHQSIYFQKSYRGHDEHHHQRRPRQHRRHNQYHQNLIDQTTLHLSNSEHYTWPVNGKSNCNSIQPTQSKDGNKKKYVTCAKPCNTITDLTQHHKETYHFKGPNGQQWGNSEMLYDHLIAYYEEHVMVLRDYQRKCRKIVHDEIGKIREMFKKDDTEFHKSNTEPAGSTATIGYDFNLVLKEEEGDVIVDDRKSIYFSVYGNENGANHLQSKWKFDLTLSNQVPPGYTTLRYKGDRIQKNWAYFGFTGPYWDTETDYHTGYIIPRWVQHDLYSKLKLALKFDKNISVSCVPRETTITINVKSLKQDENHKSKDHVLHDISVGLSVAIEVDRQQIPVDKYGWPRKKTMQCFSKDTIDMILETSVYLVPKDNLFWYISFSNAAKVLMRNIDSPNTCRRMCHKILKTDFLTWKSEQTFKGISSFIFKNQLFWFNENLEVGNSEEYWNISNIGQCYVQLLKDLKERLVLKKLPNYFNEEENLLQLKDTGVLNRLADRITKRIEELDDIILKYD